MTEPKRTPPTPDTPAVTPPPTRSRAGRAAAGAKKIVAELDRSRRKPQEGRAIAVRNRWRAARRPEEIRDEILPNNIIMIGPPAWGDEIARAWRGSRVRVVKVEASKFTRVGYVRAGRGVDESASWWTSRSNMVRTERRRRVPAGRAAREERLLTCCFPPVPVPRPPSSTAGSTELGAGGAAVCRVSKATSRPRSLGRCEGTERRRPHREEAAQAAEGRSWRSASRGRGAAAGLPESGDDSAPQGRGTDVNSPRAAGDCCPRKRSGASCICTSAAHSDRRGAEEARRHDDECERSAGPRRNHGIIFIDEIDKIGGAGHVGPTCRARVCSATCCRRRGLDRTDAYASWRTDHVLFIAAARSTSRSLGSDPGLQGRFPSASRLSPSPRRTSSAS